MNESEQTMTRYLLGELSEAEQSALEQRYFSDPHVFDQVAQAENQLVDDYIRGELSPQARARLEQYYFAHPKRRERAKFAEALATKLDQVEAVKGSAEPSVQMESWWARLLAALSGRRLALGFSMALLLIVVGGVWSLTERRRQQRELAQTQAAQADQARRERELQQQLTDERIRANELAAKESQANELAAELERRRAQQQTAQTKPGTPARSVPTFATLLLTVGGVRGADTGPPAVLVIPAGTEQVHLQLKMKENDYQSYGVVLQPVGGKEIFSRASLKAKPARSGASFLFVVPAGRFATSDYILTLKGITQTGEVKDLSKSIFRVEKR